MQLPTILVLRTLEAAWSESVDIEERASQDLLFGADPKVPIREVVVRTGQSVVTLPTYNPGDFPATTPVELKHAVKIEGRRFWRLLGRTWTRFETATNGGLNRYKLAGYAFEFSERALHCIAISTDGGRRVHAIEDATGNGLIAPPLTAMTSDEERALLPIVPSGALHALAGILDVEEYRDITLGFTAERKFQVQAPGLFFVTDLVEERLPVLEAFC